MKCGLSAGFGPALFLFLSGAFCYFPRRFGLAKTLFFLLLPFAWHLFGEYSLLLVPP